MTVRVELRDEAIVGTFGAPDGARSPGVLALGGSEGGIPSYLVDPLVAEGFACLALAYHAGLVGAELSGLVPSAMFELPLERIERGLRWLIDQPSVATDNGPIGVVGFSKGAELALVIAAAFPDLVGPVVAYSPSNVVWQGFSWASNERVARSTWSFDGRGLPFLPFGSATPAFSDRGVRTSPMYDTGLDDSAASAEAAAIRVERAMGPILVISGGDDGIWPAERMSRLLVERMTGHDRGDDITHVHLPDAGHILFEGFEVPNVGMDVGGSSAATSAAHGIVWPQVLATLRGDGRDRATARALRPG